MYGYLTSFSPSYLKEHHKTPVALSLSLSLSLSHDMSKAILGSPCFSLNTLHFFMPPFISSCLQSQKMSFPLIVSNKGFGGISGRRMNTVSCSVSKDGNMKSVEMDIRFPRDYPELLEQAKAATELAFKDNIQLMEIEFPTAGLESVPGDGEGGIEMTGSMQLIREFCDIFVVPENATRTRIFFPEANEVGFARKSAFEGSSLKLDYLTKPSLFEDFGFVTKVKMADRVKPEDEVFLVAYPYFNVNEMLVVEELYKDAVADTTRKLIIFNGELDRIRSGYYPPFFYPKLAALNKTFLPKLETVYYIHNFKGRNGGILFRCYPGPWKVLRKARDEDEYVCLHQQEKMPSLKEVALDILPSA